MHGSDQTKNSHADIHYQPVPILSFNLKFHSRQLNQKINKVQTRTLRITYKDNEFTFSELLQKNWADIIHTKNLQLLLALRHSLETLSI